MITIYGIQLQHVTPKYIVKMKLSRSINKKESWGVELYFLCSPITKKIWIFFNFRKEIGFEKF